MPEHRVERLVGAGAHPVVCADLGLDELDVCVGGWIVVLFQSVSNHYMMFPMGKDLVFTF